MRAVRPRPVLAAALGGLLVLAAAPAAFADPLGGDDGDAREVAVGTDAGNIDYNDTPQAPDTGTTVAVGGDSNLGVPQPELSRVPSTGDGIFALDVEPSGVTMTTAAPPAAPATGSAPATDAAAAAPVEGDAAAVPTCADYPSWYDAQIALESAGDPALAASLDPDGNGIACEEGMV